MKINPCIHRVGSKFYELQVYICCWSLLHLFGFRILYQEIDYINEGKNADRFRRDFRNVKWVRVPICFYLQNLMIVDAHFLSFLSQIYYYYYYYYYNLIVM